MRLAGHIQIDGSIHSIHGHDNYVNSANGHGHVTRRKPAYLPPGDSRFTTSKHKRIYICDRCAARVAFNTQALPFFGAYKCKSWHCHALVIEVTDVVDT